MKIKRGGEIWGMTQGLNNKNDERCQHQNKINHYRLNTYKHIDPQN